MASVTNERDQLNESRRRLTAQRDQLQKELTSCATKAAVSDEHSMYATARELEEEQRWAEAARWYHDFLEHYPNSAMVGAAREHLAPIQARLDAEKARQDRQAEAQKLQRVLMPEIFARIDEYRGKSIVRSVRCDEIRRGRGELVQFSSECTVSSSHDVEVVYSSDAVAALAGVRRDSLGLFSYRARFEIVTTVGDDVVLVFAELAPDK